MVARSPSRRAPLLALLVAALLLVQARPSLAHHRFGQDAGWSRARAASPRSVRVWALPSLHIDLRAVIRPWNRLAGWKLFRVARRAGPADVLFMPSSATWVQCDPSYAEAYTRCVIWSATSETRTHRHEIGHALGFADHVPAAVWAQGSHVSPAVCDETDHELYARYRGVMSYCGWQWGGAWFGWQDRRMLARAGYRVIAEDGAAAARASVLSSAWPAPRL